MTTPHIAANPGDFAETVLMPGDPLRARFIAEHYLDDVRQVTAVRNMLGYTGHYRGQRVSVMEAGHIVEQLDIAGGQIPAGSRLASWLADQPGIVAACASCW